MQTICAEDLALRLAYWRLRYPAELTDPARLRYETHLRRNLGAALRFAMQEEDMQGLRLLLPLGKEAPETLDAALAEARARHLTEATALLLEQRRARPGAGRAKKWEL